MSEQHKTFWILAVIDAVVFFIVAVLWIAASATTSDTQTALGFAFMVGFIFMATPLFASISLYAFLLVQKQGTVVAKWPLTYAIFSVAAHMGLAYDSGFLDKWLTS